MVIALEEFYVIVIFLPYRCHFRNYKMDKSIEILLEYYQKFLDTREKQVHMMLDSCVEQEMVLFLVGNTSRFWLKSNAYNLLDKSLAIIIHAMKRFSNWFEINCSIAEGNQNSRLMNN